MLLRRRAAATAFPEAAGPRRVLRRIARAVDERVSRGEGLDARADPYGPPMRADEVARALALVREARFAAAAPPFASPIPLSDTPAQVPVVLHAPADGARRWAILAHPYGAFERPGRLGIYALHAAALRARGFGVAAPELPYHGARAFPGKPSGWGFVRADLGLTSRALAAGAAEVAALARHLREERDAREVVGVGISLGAAPLGLAAATGAAFDGLAFLAAVDNPAAFYATGENREARRRTLRAAGVSHADVVAAFAPLAPSSHPAPAARSLFAIPPEDLVVPADAQERWRAAWRGEALRLPWEGHAVALASPIIAIRLAKWLAQSPKPRKTPQQSS